LFASVPCTPSWECSVIRRPGSSHCTDGEKTGLWSVWSCSAVLLRPQGTKSPGSVLRGHAHLPSEDSMDVFFQWLGPRKSQRIRLAVMDMWTAFRNSTVRNAPQASILFDTLHVMRHLGEALDKVRKSE